MKVSYKNKCENVLQQRKMHTTSWLLGLQGIPDISLVISSSLVKAMPVSLIIYPHVSSRVFGLVTRYRIPTN